MLRKECTARDTTQNLAPDMVSFCQLVKLAFPNLSFNKMRISCYLNGDTRLIAIAGGFKGEIQELTSSDCTHVSIPDPLSTLALLPSVISHHHLFLTVGYVCHPIGFRGILISTFY